MLDKTFECTLCDGCNRKYKTLGVVDAVFSNGHTQKSSSDKNLTTPFSEAMKRKR